MRVLVQVEAQVREGRLGQLRLLDLDAGCALWSVEINGRYSCALLEEEGVAVVGRTTWSGNGEPLNHIELRSLRDGGVMGAVRANAMGCFNLRPSWDIFRCRPGEGVLYAMLSEVYGDDHGVSVLRGLDVSSLKLLPWMLRYPEPVSSWHLAPEGALTLHLADHFGPMARVSADLEVHLGVWSGLEGSLSMIPLGKRAIAHNDLRRPRGFCHDSAGGRAIVLWGDGQVQAVDLRERYAETIMTLPQHRGEAIPSFAVWASPDGRLLYVGMSCSTSRDAGIVEQIQVVDLHRKELRSSWKLPWSASSVSIARSGRMVIAAPKSGVVAAVVPEDQSVASVTTLAGEPCYVTTSLT